MPTIAAELEAQGKTLLFVARDDELAGVLAAADTLRPEVPAALAEVRALGMRTDRAAHRRQRAHGRGAGRRDSACRTAPTCCLKTRFAS